MSNKPIIVFEGIEGSGKTSHIKNVEKYLKKNNKKFIKIREPGGSKNSERIRKLILDNKSTFNNTTDLLLYLAARSENISLLKKHYKKKIILLDRFTDSTIAYQHYGFGVDIKLIKTINNLILKKFKVDYTFLNIVNKNNMIKRLKIRKSLNRYDKFNTSFYQKVQRGFITLANKNKKKYSIVISNYSIDYNKKIILRTIDKILWVIYYL